MFGPGFDDVRTETFQAFGSKAMVLHKEEPMEIDDDEDCLWPSSWSPQGRHFIYMSHIENLDTTPSEWCSLFKLLLATSITSV